MPPAIQRDKFPKHRSKIFYLYSHNNAIASGANRKGPLHILAANYWAKVSQHEKKVIADNKIGDMKISYASEIAEAFTCKN